MLFRSQEERGVQRRGPGLAPPVGSDTHLKSSPTGTQACTQGEDGNLRLGMNPWTPDRLEAEADD